MVQAKIKILSKYITGALILLMIFALNIAGAKAYADIKNTVYFGSY